MWYIPGIDEALQLITQYNPHNNNDIELISGTYRFMHILHMYMY